MSRRRFAVLWVLWGLGLTGCVGRPVEGFTLEVDLPANFRFIGAANYSPATGHTCTLPQRRGKRPERKIFIARYKPVAERVSYELPLSETIEGCPTVLRSVEFDIYAKWGARETDVGGDLAGIAIRDRPDVDWEAGSSVQELRGRCQWLFRTAGPKHAIIKILKCSSLHAKASGTAGVVRDHLAGKALRINLEVSSEERPYMGNTWIRFPQGWKRCLGQNHEDPYGFCRGESNTFRSFKMPDGRLCNIYPGCTE